MDPAEITHQLLRLFSSKQEELAQALGVKQPTISRWLNGADPRGEHRDALFKLARDRGILVDPSPARGAPSSRFRAVPLLSWVSAGRLTESVETPAQDVRTIMAADLGKGDFFALTVAGSVMDRISPDGSTIIVNRADKALHGGKPYVVAIKGEAIYRLWRPSPPRLEPFSTDPKNETIYIDRRQSMAVIGRVCRSILDF